MNKSSYILKSPSSSLITALEFNSNYILLCATFDGKITLYDTKIETLRRVYDNLEAEDNILAQIDVETNILTAHWLDDTNVICGLVNGSIYIIDFKDIVNPVLIDLNDEEDSVIEAFQLGVCSICVVDRYTVIAGSWDKTIKIIDLVKYRETLRLQLPGKVFSMDYSQVSKTLVCCLSNRDVKIYKFKSVDRLEMINSRENGFKFQTRAVKCIPDGTGFVQGSIEGKVSVDYFDEAAENQGYAFKCHREVDSEEANTDIVNPVNTLAFHTKYLSLFTGGSDGHACIWDFKAKKRITKYPRLDAMSSVMQIDYEESQNIVAIGYSDDSFKNMQKKDS